MSDSEAYGPRGEAFAARIYERDGWVVLARNYRIPMGELDLIVRKEDELRAVEVKTRTAGAPEAPQDAVTLSKRKKIARALLHYLDKTGFDGTVRVDVFELIIENGRPARYRIVECPMEDTETLWLP